MLYKNWRQTGLLLMVLLVLLNWIGSAEAGIKVTPVKFIYHLESGERTTGVITVVNETDQELDLQAVYYDWTLDQMYNLVTHPSGTLKETLDGLLKFNPRTFHLKPGESQLVRVTVTSPEGDVVPFERRGIIFFEHEEFFDQEGIGASVKQMIGTTVYLLPITYELSVQLKGYKVGLGTDGNYWTGLLIANECLVHIRFTIGYKVIDSENRVMEEGSVEEKVFLPGMSGGVFFPLKQAYTPGSYRLLLQFDFEGTEEGMTQSIPFEIKE